jgi:hypothetical protein
MEQVSNALALRQPGWKISTSSVGAWLERPRQAPAVRFPDVADALARWLAGGCKEATAALGERLWGRVPAVSAGMLSRRWASP